MSGRIPIGALLITLMSAAVLGCGWYNEVLDFAGSVEFGCEVTSSSYRYRELNITFDLYADNDMDILWGTSCLGDEIYDCYKMKSCSAGQECKGSALYLAPYPFQFAGFELDCHGSLFNSHCNGELYSFTANFVEETSNNCGSCRSFDEKTAFAEEPSPSALLPTPAH